MFYGPGTGFEAAPGKPAVHVDAAAQAAMLAIVRGAPGIYNIAEDDGAVSIAKARRELGWDPGFRLNDSAVPLIGAQVGLPQRCACNVCE